MGNSCDLLCPPKKNLTYEDDTSDEELKKAIACKVIVVGPMGVGKTTIIQRLLEPDR
jgi:GTPase SAR1 family protein